MSPIITVTNLTKRYKNSPTNAVDGISFSVAPGEFFYPARPQWGRQNHDHFYFDHHPGPYLRRGLHCRLQRV